MSKHRAIRRAKDLVRSHGLSEPPVDVYGLAASLGIQIVERELAAGTSGLLLRHGNLTVCVVNKQHAPVRKRFTVAHELGHFVLHPPAPEYDGVHTQRRDLEASSGTSLKEIEANAFAAELLMPEALVRERFARVTDLFDLDERDVHAAAKDFEVSQQAMAYRLVSLGILVE